MTLNLEREFNSTAQALFEAIKDGVLFMSCGFNQESMKIDFKVGGRYWMQYEEHPAISGEFLEIVPNKKVVFTWGEMDTKVTIVIEEKNKTSLLKLTHELIPDNAWKERFQGGWTFGFNNLTKKIST